MKKIFLSLIVASILLASCNEEFIDPTRPSKEKVFSSRVGLIGAANGLQNLWSVGGASPVYTTITANGFTAKELRLLNAGNISEFELSLGSGSLTPGNSLTNNLWNYCLIVNSESQKIIDNINILGVTTEKATVLTHASIFKALALGTLIQYYQQIPLQTIQNSPFNSRGEVLSATIATLKATEPYLNDAVGFTGMVNSIKYKNTVYALLARYYLMAGDNDNALVYANLVDLTSKSTFLYDAISNNPISASSILTNNVYQPVDRTLGLPVALTPTTGDGRIDFYIDPTSPANATRALGFFNTNLKLIPVYLPGEMTLIKAEVFTRKNQLPQAVVELNKILTKTAASDAFGVGANLPVYSGVVDQPSLFNEIYKNRCIELYMSGLKLEDSRRFLRPGAELTNGERNRNWYPYPLSERNNNPNTPADPNI